MCPGQPCPQSHAGMSVGSEPPGWQGPRLLCTHPTLRQHLLECGPYSGQLVCGVLAHAAPRQVLPARLIPTRGGGGGGASARSPLGAHPLARKKGLHWAGSPGPSLRARAETRHPQCQGEGLGHPTQATRWLSPCLWKEPESRAVGRAAPGALSPGPSVMDGS